MQRILGTTAVLLVLTGVQLGCGSGGHPQPGPLSVADRSPAAERALPEAYRLHVGDEIYILVLENDDLSRTVKVQPDGKITAPGAGELHVAGKTVGEVAEHLRSNLRRLLRYPDVSVMLSDYAEQQIYVLGEVKQPGARPYVPAMTTLHAVGAAAGPLPSGKMSTVIILRRSGPSDMDVYRVNLKAAMDGSVTTRDFFLQPYDVVYVPRTIIAEVNLFVDQFVRKNLVAFTAYIEGWKTFHLGDWRSYEVP
ncbi:MAG: polysaccharide export protein [Candidatus Eisenbacteria sp.]|nr:polysaccharide export protein [Candidatus Eisenbacteria bacterium]